MAHSPVSRATSTPKPYGIKSVTVADWRSLDFTSTAPKTAGMEMRNEKRAAISPRIPRNIAVAIVFDDREMPGSMAKACVVPIRIASRIFKSPAWRVALGAKVVLNSRVPFTKRPHAATVGEVKRGSTAVSKIKPMIPVGTVATTISQNQVRAGKGLLWTSLPTRK